MSRRGEGGIVQWREDVGEDEGDKMEEVKRKDETRREQNRNEVNQREE